jgi:hypothetical protein
MGKLFAARFTKELGSYGRSTHYIQQIGKLILQMVGNQFKQRYMAGQI